MNRVCLSQIKSEHIGDAARPGLEGEEYALPSEPCAIGAHPCPTIGACASHYSSKTAARDGRYPSPIQQHGQGIPAKSTDQPFSTCVLPRRARRRRSITNAHGSNASNKDFAIGPVPVADQIARGLLPAARTAEIVVSLLYRASKA